VIPGLRDIVFLVTGIWMLAVAVDVTGTGDAEARGVARIDPVDDEAAGSGGDVRCLVCSEGQTDLFQ